VVGRPLNEYQYDATAPRLVYPARSASLCSRPTTIVEIGISDSRRTMTHGDGSGTVCRNTPAPLRIGRKTVRLCVGERRPNGLVRERARDRDSERARRTGQDAAAFLRLGDVEPTSERDDARKTHRGVRVNRKALPTLYSAATTRHHRRRRAPEISLLFVHYSRY